MSSIIQGYEYDIFISYRQKDNKYDGWVTEFVENLEKELDATFKEEVSVYFDVNPHDGLLETYNVDASLKEKLKCLVFIPIISQTYCDPKSFAWQNEFVAFNTMCQKDFFGRDIKLENGNVASRILPIKIHELDRADIALIENETGNVLRSVDFIFKTPGVNRPLRANEDHPQDNLNKTYYRDQINKVANSVKEIIIAINKNTLREENPAREDFKISSGRPKKQNTKYIIAFILVTALLVIGYSFIKKSYKSSDSIEKSIAALPFKLLSEEADKQYLADGMMDAILLNLQKLKDLRVMSSTSVEQYRNTKKTIQVIGQELNVQFLVEGSFQKYRDSVRLIVKLIKSRGGSQVWSNEYDRKWKDIFSVQSEVAQSVAREMDAVITPEEKKKIEIVPTYNLTAYDFYEKGRDEYSKYVSDNNNLNALKRAESYYHQTLKYDSNYAQAYTGLARVFWEKHSNPEEFFSNNYMDSVLILCNIALSLDNKLAEAYSLRGDYYTWRGATQEAIDEYDHAIAINPNFSEAYRRKGFVYEEDDYIKSIDNYQKASALNHGKELPDLLRTISTEYLSAGFLDQSKYLNTQAFALDQDSSIYLDFVGFTEFLSGNYDKALTYYFRAYSMDTSNVGYRYDIAYTYMFQNKSKLTLKYFRNDIDTVNFHRSGVVAQINHIGWALWENGQRKKAEFFFNKQLEYSKSMIQLKRPWGQKLYTYYDMAGVYAYMGDKENAYKYLKQFNQRRTMPYWIQIYMKSDPLFNSIRGEAAFQQIAKEIEIKYLSEHKRVEKWLAENNML